MDSRIEDALEVLQRHDSLLATVAYAVDRVIIAPMALYPMAAAMTDYKSITIDPRHPGLNDNPEELVFSLAHECAHILCLHAQRQGSRKAMKWNVCCDKAINRNLSAWLTVPPNRPIDKSETPLSEEELYEKDKHDYGDDGAQCYTEIDPNDPNVQAVMQRIDAIIEATKKAGTGEGWLQHLPCKDARLPLPKILRNVIVRGRHDYTWARPSRGGRAHGIYLPSLGVRPSVGTLMLSLDTSGSMPDEEVVRGLGSIRRIAVEGGINRLIVVCQDTVATVCYDGPPSGYSYQRTKMRRNGGTDFGPLMTLAGRIRPRALIAITDMEGDFGVRPPCRVFWVTTSASITPPFGTVCRW